MENTFDFIVVGGRAAGCVVAEKLSRYSSGLVLEAGVSGLRVIDASIMPEHFERKLRKLPVVAIAEIASNMVVEDNASLSSTKGE